jgi:hypothetical protein
VSLAASAAIANGGVIPTSNAAAAALRNAKRVTGNHERGQTVRCVIKEKCPGFGPTLPSYCHYTQIDAQLNQSVATKKRR